MIWHNSVPVPYNVIVLKGSRGKSTALKKFPGEYYTLIYSTLYFTILYCTVLYCTIPY